VSPDAKAVEIDAEAPAEVFFLVFTTDCSDGWLSTKVLIQPCRVETAGLAHERAFEQAVAQPDREPLEPPP
jgi:hypothetical protein